MGDMVAKYWSKVAARFSQVNGVLAYEIMNEPWWGDIYSDPTLMESGVAEKKAVGPFMERMHGIIRSQDAITPILFAPAEMNNRLMRPVGYDDGFLPGEPMAWHGE